MINKTQAIVLKIIPYSQSSHIVTWLTPEQGKLTTIIKGALRPKSSFLGQYDLFYTCELLYYIRETNGLHIARECSPIQTRLSFRRDWKAAACASYIADLLLNVSYSGNHQPELYELIDLSMEHLAANGVKPVFIFWFELKLAELLGFAPQLLSCVACRRELAQQERLMFSSADGGLICQDCSIKPNLYQSGKAQYIAPDIIAMLRSLKEAASPKAVQNIRFIKNQLLDLQNILGTFIVFHMDLKPLSRAKAISIINYNPGDYK